MTVYRLKGPDGQVHRLEGPPGASEAQVREMAAKFYSPQGADLRTVADKPLGALSALANGAVNSATFGLDKGLAAAIEAVGLPGKNDLGERAATVFDPGSTPDGDQSFWGRLKQAYAKNYKTAQRVANAEHDVYPGPRLAGQTAGVFTGGGIASKAMEKVGAKAAPFIHPLLAKLLAHPVIDNAITRGAATGATVGAGVGAANANPGTRGGGATLGAITGGIGGAAISGTVAGLGPVVQKYLNAFAGKNLDKAAMSQIVTGLRRAGYDVSSPKGVLALKTEMANLGHPASLADIGVALRSRAGVGMRSPNPAQQSAIDTVLQRQAGSPDRLSQAITDNVAPRTDVHAVDEALVAQRAAQAGPLKLQAVAPANPQLNAPVGEADITKYIAQPGVQDALQAGAEPPALHRPATLPVVPDDPILHALTQLPQAQGAVLRAARAANNERSLLEALGQPTDHLPEFPEGNAPLDMKALDYLKKSLDKEVTAAYSSTDGATRSVDAPQLKNLRNAIKDRMVRVGESSKDAADGPYADYLQSYSDHSSMLDALRTGRGGNVNGRDYGPGFLALDPEIIAKIQEKATPTEAELGRVGMARGLEDKVMNTPDGAQPASRILNTPNARARVAASGVPEENLSDLVTRIANEKRYGQLTAELGGSQTQGRQAAAQDAGADMLDHPPYPTYHGVLRSILNHVVGGVNLSRNAGINEELLPRLLEQDPAAISKTIDALAEQGKTDAADKLRRAAQARFGAAAAGIALGSPVTYQPGQ